MEYTDSPFVKALKTGEDWLVLWPETVEINDNDTHRIRGVVYDGSSTTENPVKTSTVTTLYKFEESDFNDAYSVKYPHASMLDSGKVAISHAYKLSLFQTCMQTWDMGQAP